MVPLNSTIADYLGGAELDSFQQLFIAAREPLLAQASLPVGYPLHFLLLHERSFPGGSTAQHGRLAVSPKCNCRRNRKRWRLRKRRRIRSFLQ